MTRINVGIPPKDLNTKHLIAEHREIKRVPNLIKKGRLKSSNIPSNFTLGTGHIKFFYDKLGYLLNRYIDLYDECKKRGFKVQNYIESWENIPERLMKDYTPTEQDIQLIKTRIAEKLKLMK